MLNGERQSPRRVAKGLPIAVPIAAVAFLLMMIVIAAGRGWL